MLPVFLLRAGRGGRGEVCFAKSASHHNVIRVSKPRPGPRLSSPKPEGSSRAADGMRQACPATPGSGLRGAPISSVSVQKAPQAKQNL